LADDDTSYDPTSDQIGTPELDVSRAGLLRVEVNVDRPVVYTTVSATKVGSRQLTQLIYSYWFPRHPVGGIQKGDVDGGVVRVTVDATERPVAYEHVFPCGCYHGTCIPDTVESWAAAEFETLEKEKSRYTERHVEEQIDWVVRDVVIGAHTHRRPIIFSQAGSHLCSAIQTEAVVRGLEQFPEQTYTLRPYSDLSRIQVKDEPGRFDSMFDADGLVWGGRRWGEEIVFNTMDHPGWPRRLDQIKIHWDEMFLMDTSLLGTHLRLPAQIESETLLVQRQKPLEGGRP